MSQHPTRLAAFEAWLPTEWLSQRLVAALEPPDRELLRRVLDDVPEEKMTPGGFAHWWCCLPPDKTVKDQARSMAIYEVVASYVGAVARAASHDACTLALRGFHPREINPEPQTNKLRS